MQQPLEEGIRAAAAGNAGTALGAVFHAWHQVWRQRAPAQRRISLAGPQLQRGGDQAGAGKLQAALPIPALRSMKCWSKPSSFLATIKIVAWMQGRMEFGPRALGNRSILASPLDPYSTENLNIFIKHREPFRKFAASVPAELAGEYFEVGPNARYLATVGRVRPAHARPLRAPIWHGDLVRVHTVSEAGNPLYWLCCTQRARPRACRCSTIPGSICSASRWSPPRATPCGASTPRESTPCSWAISSCRNRRTISRRRPDARPALRRAPQACWFPTGTPWRNRPRSGPFQAADTH